ncbi:MULTISPECIES: phosphoenolpyruvate--protein phosphotransferase [unclassified Coprococcus]|jgi:phosphoenolpyruvate-protein phosphotransferase|uniref:phosphoenolpyruvate--protein phosphotransferase n=1 Tax=unclassified Coprococcus TaxID=2684943 RepID=UPI000E4BE05D|nr:MULTISPECIES: phosphoenolpyruvate--protein phosphotransferase [unclassified Coprococcus]MBD9292604.1 phosphoenolpyruvate--protein phosphotransferase [Coprococcus eutactus]RGI34979.1 phosphoenolpyruvate--protein phosphotransferase [Coprococcus sp. OM06-34AC]RGI41897.1 phosphoenolpyruvate--protein phosphotransferase [Coprococcus sp. OM06-25]
MNKGIAGSAGYGVGKVVIISDAKPEYENRTITDTDAEIKRYDDAVAAFTEKTHAMAEAMKESVGEHNAEILEGHILLLTDPGMDEITKGAIMSGTCAEAAFESTCDMFAGMFQMADDELTRQRATDIGDIKVRMLKILTGTPDVNISEVPAGTILVAEDLTPSMTAGIVKENVAGIITAVGGKTSHSAILARALEIPAVLSVDGIVDKVSDGMTAVVDGCEGICILDPSQEEIDEYQAKREKYLSDKALLEVYRGKDTVTADGVKVHLYGNIGNPEDAKQVAACDGEGVGLFRTEFLFMGASELPSEEEQFQAYKAAAETMEGREVIIRTLDVGGDKDIPYLGLEKEDNPFLGFRAVRYCLQNKDSYRVQLRALLRASAFGDIKIMVPLVTCVDEIRSVKALVKELMAELDAENIAYNKDIQVGAMIETPAASLIADLLAKEADFFSIGTNDLTQYTMAVDRGNAKVAYLYSSYNPAVLRSMKNIIEAANAAGIMVGMCGEAAADPLLIPLLISFGLGEFSVSATSVLATRGTIAKWSKAEADELAAKALSLATETEVAELLKANAR